MILQHDKFWIKSVIASADISRTEIFSMFDTTDRDSLRLEEEDDDDMDRSDKVNSLLMLARGTV